MRVWISATESVVDWVPANIYLADMTDFDAVNSIYTQYFGVANNLPARSCVAVKSLPFGTDVEMECVALL
ncbi:Endoribonuclease L-PSP/chorismate mutase-like protein [Aspergillus heterothallicus]